MRVRRRDRINAVLSDELILEIFRRVDLNSSRGAISLVCRRWFNLERLSRRSDHPDSIVAVCDICGDIGVAELITTCSKCKTSREHAYCRKVLTENYLDDWSCDNCNVDKKGWCENEKREKRVTFASEPPVFERVESIHSALRGQHHLKEKFVNKGKVKCISSQEIIKLCSGSRKGETLELYKSSEVRTGRPMCSKTVVHENVSPKSPATPFSLSNSMQTSFLIKQLGSSPFARDAVKPMETKLAVPGKEMHRPSESSSACSLEKQLLPPVSSVAVTPAVEARTVPKEAMCAPSLKKQFEKLSASDAVKPVTETHLPSSGKEIHSEASSAHSLGNQSLQPIGSVTVGPSVETRAASKRKTASVTNEVTCAPTLMHLKKPKTCVNTAMKTKEASTGKEASNQVESDKFARGPAQASSWKGQFEFVDDILRKTKFENVARTCSITSRKVLEFSKKMPRQLQFKLIHRKEIWTDLFQDGCANENDIGLYFYSGEKNRSSGYDLVLSLMEGQDLALRCELHGVVLYLFTSKTLSADYQTWDGHHYLWGVLHKIKKQKNVSELYKELPSTV